MPDYNEAGLNYSINVTGNFDQVFSQLEKRVDALAKKSQATAKQATKVTSKEGGLDEEAVVRKKIASLQAQQVTLSNKAVQKEQQITNEVKQRTKQANRLIATEKGLVRTAQQQAQITKALGTFTAQRKAAVESLTKAEEARRDTVRKAQQEQFNSLKKEASLWKKEQTTRAKDINKQVVADQSRIKSAKESAAVFQSHFKEQEKAAVQAKKVADYNNLDLQARKRIEASARELAIKQSQINQLVKTQGISQRKAADRVGLTSAQAKQLKLNMFDADHAARQFLFTFRRLVGILAIFTAARKLAQALAAGVKEMADFNAELEIAEISIAQIVASVGQIRDGTGELISGAEGFGLALGESRKIITQLKKDALGSIATFEALVKAYQVAVGPGLGAGLNLDQIRTVSKQLAEGALALGVPLNQLSEEIRSLLKGTATDRNTRIAVLFGGAKEANKAIRRAKEEGNLFETLTKKLLAVKIGADAAEQSLAVLQSNLQDTVQLLLAEGGIAQFNALKESIQGFTRALVEYDSKGDVVGFTPEAIGVVREIAGGLADIQETIRSLGSASQVFVALRTTLAAIRGTINALLPVVVGLTRGLVEGFNLATAPIRIVARFLKVIANLTGFKQLNKTTANIVKSLTAGAVALFLWTKFISSSKALFITLVKPLVSVGQKLNSLVRAQATIQAQQLGIIIGTKAWNRLLIFTAIKMGLITGGLSLALGWLASLVVSSKTFRRLLGDSSDSLDDSNDAAEDLFSNISGASSAMQDNLRTAKEWEDEFKDLNAEARKLRAALGLSEIGEEVSNIVEDFRKLVEDESEAYRKQLDHQNNLLKTQEEKIAKLKEEIRLEKDRLKLTQSKVGGPTGFFPSAPSSVKTRVDPSEKLEDAEKDLSALENGRKDILTELEGIERKALENLGQAQNKLAAGLAETNVEKAFRQAEAYQGIADAQADGAKEAVAAKLQADAALRVAQSRVALLEEERATDQALFESQKKRFQAAQADLNRLRVLGELSLSDYETEFAKLQEALNALEDINKRADEDSTVAMRQADEEHKNAQREADESGIRASGTIAENIGLSLQNWIDEMPTAAEEFSNIITDALSDLSGVVADTFKDAIDPRTDADLQTAFGEFFLDLAGTFVEALTQRLIIASGIEKLLDLGKDKAEEAPEVAATTANTTATTANTTAITSNTTATAALTGAVQSAAASEGVSAAAEDAAASAPEATGAAQQSSIVAAIQTQTTQLVAAFQGGGAGGGLLIGGGGGGAGGGTTDTAAKASGSFFAGIMNNPYVYAALIGIIIAMLSQAFSKGGKVKGFAKGGKIKGYAGGGGIPRPSNIPSSDTVPAMLTPGEFVIKKDSVKKFGVGFMEKLNAGIMPTSFAMAGASLAGSARGIQHFASGGSVRPSASSGGGESRTIVLPVMPTTEDNLDQMISGGRSTFTKKVNSVDYVGDLNKSRRW